MNPATSPLPADTTDEVAALIDLLHRTGQRLEELTAGEVDSVADRDGHTFLLRHAQEHLRHNEAVRQAAILNVLPAHIALLDTQGRIVSANEAWERYAGTRLLHSPGHGIGLNYLEICDGANANDPSRSHAVAAGIRAVLKGTTTSFSIEYPCHSAAAQCWFQLTATPLSNDTPHGAVVMHVSVTERKRAELALRDYAERLKSVSRKLLEVQEEERRVLARELHDRVGQELCALSLNLSLIRGALPGKAAGAIRSRIDDSQALLELSSLHLRDVMAELRPPGLDELGLLAALKEHARLVAQRTGLAINVTGARFASRLPPASEIALFRITQEALNNIVKHAHATTVTISLQAPPSTAVLTVTDNGRGFDGARQPGGGAFGMGMLTMRERAEAIGAEVRVESPPGEGTRVIVDTQQAAVDPQQAMLRWA